MFKESMGTMVKLATTAFGLVAALAWNEAIKNLFATIFGERAGIISLFVYAALVKVIAVMVTNRLGKLAEKMGAEVQRK
jgi:hypothetical protein